MKADMECAVDIPVTKRRVFRVRIGASGARIPLLDATWWAEWMSARQGDLLEMRIDASDARVAHFFEVSDSSAVGTANIRTVGGQPVVETSFEGVVSL